MAADHCDAGVGARARFDNMTIMGLIGAIIVSLALPIGLWMAYIDIKRWDKLIKEAGKQAREKEYIFVNEEKRCSYCGKPISKQEYERERHSYCDECSFDLETEEETADLWRI